MMTLEMARLEAGDDVGRYHLESRLGGGASGTVFRALDRELGVHVALKVLTPRLMNDDEAWERAKRELILARRVTHPGVSRLFDIHEHEGWRFITMELVEGATLRDVLARDGVFPPPRAVRVVAEVASALAAAHRVGVIHRDLKPLNIMLRQGDRPVILDFGFAIGHGTTVITGSGITLGTPHYTAPEVLTGSPASTQSDLYSLGVILYQCLTGRLPYDVKDFEGLRAAHKTSRPVPPAQYSPAVPKALAALTMQALAPTPDERPRSASAFAEALRGLGLSGGADAESSSAPWDRDIDGMSQQMSTLVRSEVIRQAIRPTTLLFSDIVGITSYFDAHGDVAGRQRIQKHNSLLMPIIERHGGEVVKTIGDAIMALFSSAAEGVTAAVEMQRALEVRNQYVDAKADEIHIRIGLHSGDAIVERDDVFGDTVNVAARICSAAEGDQILVSGATVAQLPAGRFATSFAERRELKGKREAFDLHAVAWNEAVAVQRGQVELGAPPALKVRSRRGGGWGWVALGGAAVVGAIVYAAVRPGGRRGEVTVVSPTGVAPAAAAVQFESGASSTATTTPSSTSTSTSTSTPTPTPTPTPAPAPALVPGRRGGESQQAAFRERREALQLEMRSRGLLAGDLAEVATALRVADQALAQRRFEHAEAHLERARGLVERFEVDRPFIDKKLERFNAAYDRARLSGKSGRADSLMSEVLEAYTKGQLVEANRLLNQGFAVLGGGG